MGLHVQSEAKPLILLFMIVQSITASVEVLRCRLDGVTLCCAWNSCSKHGLHATHLTDDNFGCRSICGVMVESNLIEGAQKEPLKNEGKALVYGKHAFRPI